MPALMFDSLSKATRVLILSLLTGNWLFQDWSVSYTYLYITMSWGSFFISSQSLRSAYRISPACLSRMSRRFSIFVPRSAAALSAPSVATLSVRDIRKSSTARARSIFQLFSL